MAIVETALPLDAKPELDCVRGIDGNWIPEIELGERIRKVRDCKGMRQAEFADGIGVARAVLGRWETNETIPTATNVLRIAEVYGVNIEWLLRGSVAPSFGNANIGPYFTTHGDRYSGVTCHKKGFVRLTSRRRCVRILFDVERDRGAGLTEGR